MRVAVLGNGYLSNAYRQVTKHTTTLYSKPDINFLQPETLSKYYNDLIQHDVILNTIVTHKGTSQEVLQINFLTPVILVEKLIELGYNGRIIMIGSHGSTWTSWPGIDNTRLIYNISKSCLKNYLISLSHSGLTKSNISLLDLTKFKTPTTHNTGNDMDSVVQLVEQVIDVNNLRLLHIETY